MSDTASSSILGELRMIGRYAREVWRLVPPRQRMGLIGATFVMAMSSACAMAVPVLMGQLVDQVKRGTENDLPPMGLYVIAALYLGMIALAYAAREFLQVGRRFLVENTCTRLEKVLTVRLVAHLLKLDLSHMSTEKVGAWHGRIGRSVMGFVRFLRLGFLDLLPPFLTGTFAILTALTKQPWLALAMAGVVPASIFLTIRQIITQRGVRLRLIRTREEMDGTVVEQLGGLEYIRVADTHTYEAERISAAAERKRAKEIRHHMEMAMFGAAKALNEGFFHVLVLALAIYLAVHGRISYGDILTFSILFSSVMAPLNEVHRALDEGHECSLMVSDLLAMLHTPVDRSFSPDRVEEPALEDGAPALSVKDLVVEYTTPTGERKHALHGVTLDVQHGETIGVAGRSGSGKSTWVKVLLRLTHPTSGTVKVGGVPIAEVSRESIGNLVGYVSQQPFVFAGTIAQNIAYGSPKAKHEEIEEAARKACIHDEIMAMPGGYSALVTERGANLSGGQRQRLALARIFLKDPPILILDEGTSALDNISERSVQKAIDLARSDRTVILVAHRLSTLVDADRIVVFDDGRVVEEGTYRELLTKGGVFAELVMCGEGSPEEPVAPAA